jgi:ABC-type branched-subunit amino acid transport system substrate-binding protein
MLARLRSPWTGAVLLGIVVVVVVIALAASGGDDEDEVVIADIDRGPDTAIEIPAGEPIVIGVSTALTGPSGERGSEYRDGVIASVERWKEANGDQIAGHDIEVHAEDDGCTDSGHATIAARRLLGLQGLVGVIGPQCSGGALAANRIYAEAGIVAISGSATRTDLTTDRQPQGNFFFRTAYRNDLEGTFIGLFLIDTVGAETVYVIDNGEPFGIDLANAAHELLREGDVRVTRRSIEEGDVDFSKLAAEIVAESPDFVAFTGFNPEAALIYRQIRDAGYDGLFGGSDAAASVPNFVEPVGEEAAEGALFSGCQYPLSQDFLGDFVGTHGHEPMATFTPQYADAATVLLDAVKRLADGQAVDSPLVIEPKALRDAVRATNIQDGVTGALAFDSNGDRVPKPGDELSDVQASALEAEQEDIFTTLGLIPCQVQDGKLVAGGGPGAVEIDLP